MKKLELLAPARSLSSGKTAIDYGADAVYIGGPAFGARYAATNTVDDIARLAEYAHTFGARVFVALNTIVFENELADAERIARQMIEANADALIVQDMAFMRMGLSGIEMHASTQMCNTSAEQVEFLQNSGFARVILERGLTIEQIREIRKATTVDLEAFVHGAICVGYSGQCYLSRSTGPRSGNRGECSQPCRLPYELTDERGKVILSGKHLLSVQDMNLTERLPQLIEAGITSFKIEGRLKEESYVKNIVAHYRRELDSIIAKSDGRLGRSSSGRTILDFAPDPTRSFTRSGGLWMADGKRGGVASFDTPKATGAYVGTVGNTGRDFFELNATADLTGGDGICFVAGGELVGTNINKVEGRRVFPNRMDGLKSGVKVFRNYDHAFGTTLKQSRTRRVIDAEAQVDVSESGIILTLTDADGNTATASAAGLDQPANNPQKMLDTLRTQVQKSGDSIFDINKVEVRAGDSVPFMPVSAINELRREALGRLADARLQTPPRIEAIENRGYPYPVHHLGGEANVTNPLAERFYRDHGVETIEQAFDLRQSLSGEKVMTSAYCIRREIGECLKERPRLRGELFIRHNGNRYRLAFDCTRCEMSLYKD